MKLTIWYSDQLRPVEAFNVKEFITLYDGAIEAWTNDGVLLKYPKPVFFSCESK